MRSSLAVAVLALVLAGCYRADIDTGLAPSGQVLEEEWLLGFVGGLAMVDDFDASECTNGIASVMTRQSFLNVLVNVLTGGIVSPMEVRVECAAGPGGAVSDPIDPDAAPGEVAAALERAAALSHATGGPVYVRLGE